MVDVRASSAPAWRRVGWLLPLLVLASLAAYAAQLAVWRLPDDYGWLNPFRIVGPRLLVAGVPTGFGLAWLLGWLRRRDEWTVEQMAAIQGALSVRGLAACPARTFALLLVFCVLAVAVMSPFPLPTDQLAIAIAGTVWIARPAHLARLRTLVLETALAALTWLLVSHAFTVVKASLFLVAPPRDDLIVAAETWLFGGVLHAHVADVARASPAVARIFDHVYMSIFEHMIAASVFLAGLRHRREQVELLAALALSYLIGGVSYHLLPALGPVFAAERPAFDFLLDYRLGAFHAVQWLRANTMWVANGEAFALRPYCYVAAMPSLHVTHELVMVWYARHSRGMLFLNAAYAVLTVLATLGLGFHYALDLVAGAALAALTIVVVRRIGATALPARFAPEATTLPPRPRLAELVRRWRAARSASREAAPPASSFPA